MFKTDWKPNKSSQVPLHKQIADWIKEKYPMESGR